MVKINKILEDFHSGVTLTKHQTLINTFINIISYKRTHVISGTTIFAVPETWCPAT
jgi:hypothetical protein